MFYKYNFSGCAGTTISLVLSDILLQLQVIIPIWTHNIVKSWQLLHAEYWNLNPCLKSNNDKSYILCYCYFEQDQFRRLYQYYLNTPFTISNLEKGHHKENLSLVCLQFYEHNCLNILAGNISFPIQVRNQ